jgi:Bacterial membrane protein YfhO
MAQQKNAPKQASRSSQTTSSTPLNPAFFHIPLWAALGVFVVTTLVFFRAQLFGNAYFWEDFTEYVYPAQSFAARFLHSGELPFWNPYSFSGMPFLADVAVGFFYPPNMLLALFLENGKLSVFALESLIIAHFVLAQCTIFLLMRSLKVSDAGSLIASVSYGFSGIMVHHVFHPMMVAHFAWFPLVFLHFRKALLEENTPQRLLHSFVSGMILGVMMLSGHPQTTLYLVLFLFLYTLWILAVRFRALAQKPLQMLLLGVAAALPIAIGAGLFAVQLLHSQEFSSYSERNTMTFERASMGSMHASQAFTAFVPKLFGTVTPPNGMDASANAGLPFTLKGAEYYDYWETAWYAGLVAIVLALFGWFATLKSSERERISAFLLAASIFGFLFALGSNGFLFSLFFKLPLFDRFRIPARMIALATFAVCIMAGIGFDELFKQNLKQSKQVLKLLLAALGIAVVCSVIAASGVLSDVKTSSQGLLALFSVICIGAIIFATSRGILNVQISCALLTIFVLFDVNNAGSNFNANLANPLETYTQAEARLPMFRADFDNPDSLFRVSVRERGVMLAPRNFGLLVPTMMYEGYAPLLVERRLPPAPTPDKTNDLINLRYHIGIDTVQGTAYLRERPTMYARARMVFGAVQASSNQASSKQASSKQASNDAAATTALAQSGKVDFDNQAITEKPLPVSLSGDSASRVVHSVHCTKYGTNAMAYSVETAQNGLLVLSEIWYPAWKAMIDGQSTDILRVNYSLRGVLVPSGKHTITLRYDSDAFRAGAWISLATLAFTTLGIALLMFTISAKKRQHQEENQEGNQQ